MDRWYGLGLLLAHQPGRVGEAERAFRSAIEAGDTRAWTELGDLLRGQTDGWAEAERCYRKALEVGDRRAWISLGNLLYHQRGREQEAEDAYRAAIAAGYPGGWLGIGNLLARERGGKRAAEQVYREALASGWIEASDAGMLWRNLGHLLVSEWRLREAEEAYRNAIEAGEDSTWFGMIKPLRLALQVVLYFLALCLVVIVASGSTGAVETVVLIAIGTPLLWLVLRLRRTGAPLQQ